MNKPIALSYKEHHEVYVEDYIRLIHYQDGRVDFLIVQDDGTATEQRYDRNGKLVETRTGVMNFDHSIRNMFYSQEEGS